MVKPLSLKAGFEPGDLTACEPGKVEEVLVSVARSEHAIVGES